MLAPVRLPALHVVPSVLLWAFALCLAACAHAPVPKPESDTAVRSFVDEDAGYAFDLPMSQAFAQGTGQDNIVARSLQGVRVRLFPEHFVKAPTQSDCWDRLLERHIPSDAPNRPRTPEALAEMGAKEGLRTADGRAIFLTTSPRSRECVVLAIEGVPLYAEQAARVGFPSFRVFEPSPAVRRQLLLDAAMQLHAMNEPRAALDRFATLFEMGDVPPRALALAGAMAFQLDGDRLPLAIRWLERAVHLPPEQAFPDVYPQQAKALYAESLMHLGLAYAKVNRFEEAVARLAEAVVRVPDEPILTYNFACGLALVGQHEDALAQLAEAIRLQPDLAEYARTDPDFAALRDNASWRRIVGLD